MVGWWLAAAAAWAGEPQTIAFPTALPAGVTAAPTARELVKPRPAGVTFAVEGPPVVRDGVLVFRGVLANETSKPTAVHLANVVGSGGPLRLAPRGVAYRPDPADPAPPAGARSPVEVVLPAGARVTYEAGLRLDRWAWPDGGGDVSVDWTFDFWSEPQSGTVVGRLQPRKPAPQGG